MNMPKEPTSDQQGQEANWVCPMCLRSPQALLWPCIHREDVDHPCKIICSRKKFSVPRQGDNSSLCLRRLEREIDSQEGQGDSL